MRTGSLLRFFWLLSRPPVYLLVAFVLAVTAGLAIEFVNVGSSDFAVGSILVVQLFAASTGFTRQASRGYYDPALVSGASRFAIAQAHFLTSVLPGICAWLLVGVWEVVRSRSLDVMAFRPATLTSLVLVSAIPWAVSLKLPTLSGGVIWLVVTAGFLMTHRGFSSLAYLKSRTAIPFWRALELGLAVPLSLADGPFSIAVLATLIGIAALILGLGVVLIHRAELPLVEEVS